MTPEPMAGDDRGSEGAAGRALLGPRIVAALLLALGAILIVSALGIRHGGGYQLVGPGTVPLAVAIGTFLLAALFLVRTTLRPDDELAAKAADEQAATHWPTVGLTAAALVGYGLALDGVELGGLEIPGLGYVVATGLFVPLAAWILGSRSPLRDVVIGFAMATVVYFGFTEFLGIRLPAGILDLVL